MSRDIDLTIAALERALPGLRWEQLHVAHPGADDDGLWFFSHPAASGEVQLESSTGELPFLLEGDDGAERETVRSVDEAVRRVVARLGASLVAG